jgi:ribosomal protein S27AE
MARTAASAEATGIPDNVSLGKCGNCGVLLLAPKRRPIRLQCPRCERVHTMT